MSDQKKFRIACKCLARWQDQVLIVEEKLSGGPRAGEIIWDLPGGGLEWGESLSDGLAREVREEIGLVLPQTELVGAYEVSLIHDTDTWQVCLVYQTWYDAKPSTSIDQNPDSTEDIFAASWRPLSALLDAEQVRGSLKQFLRGLATDR